MPNDDQRHSDEINGNKHIFPLLRSLSAYTAKKDFCQMLLHGLTGHRVSEPVSFHEPQDKGVCKGEADSVISIYFCVAKN